MRFQLSRSRFGTLAVVLALAGCALPPAQQQGQTDDAPALATAQAPMPARSTLLDAQPGGGASLSDAAAVATPATAGADAKVAANAPDVSSFRQTGRASWYAFRFHGRRTASGERYNAEAMTAAHRTLPLGSYVRVSVPGSVKSVIVKINDRGPFIRSRVIDLSYAAAKTLGLDHKGTGTVQIEGLSSQQARVALTQTYASNSPSDH